jgi:hypothetical protein
MFWKALITELQVLSGTDKIIEISLILYPSAFTFTKTSLLTSQNKN